MLPSLKYEQKAHARHSDAKQCITSAQAAQVGRLAHVLEAAAAAALLLAGLHGHSSERRNT